MQNDPLANYRAWLAESVDEQLVRWSPAAPAARVAEASEEFDTRTTSDASSQRYAEACPVVGASHEQYRLREIELAGGATLIAGIHFLGGEVKEPFVGVFAQSHWLQGEALRAAHLRLLHEFEAFTPRASWWWTPSDRDLGDIAGTELDQHLVAGNLQEIRAGAPPSLPDTWELRQVFHVPDIAAPFEELYTDFHGARPDLERHVQVADREGLQECADAGGLFCCFDGSELVGLVAAQPQDQFGVRAWTMWEIVLARPHCGRGLGPALQRAALDRLDTNKASLVIGTIHHKNQPSLKTALRVGRRCVGRWTFVCSFDSIGPSSANPPLQAGVTPP